MAPSKISSRRNRRAINKTPIIGSRDLDTHRVSGPEKPPTHVQNPPIQRKVRFTYPIGATAGTFNISPMALAAEDSAEYLGAGTSVANRFSTYRPIKCEAWLAPLTASTGGTSTLQIMDSYSGTQFSDTSNLGVDYAHVAIRPCLLGRMTMLTATTTGPVFVLTTAASVGFVGQLTADVTFEAS